MKKILFFALAFSAIVSTSVFAADGVITSEDFESYSITEKYNSGSKTITYPGMSNATLTGEYIINAPGGIFEGDDVYEGNAAENIVTYAQIDDDTVVAVPGGLDNGWHGGYSYPMRLLQGGEGASSEYNKYNRRLSVVSASGNKVLQMCPAKNSYVSPAAWYGYDEIDFSRPVVIETDVTMKEISTGYFEIAFTNGNFDDFKVFEYANRESGRKNITPIIKFAEGEKILINGIEAGDYALNVTYRIKISVDATGETPVYSVLITQKSDEAVVAETELIEIDYDFSGVAGIDFYAFTPSTASIVTNLFLDNLLIEQLIFSAELKTTALVNINGKGAIMIEFSGNFNRETVTNDTIKVYDEDGDEVSGINISIPKSNRIALTFPELLPTTTYTVKMDGVESKGGLKSDSVVYFKTVDAVSFTSLSKLSDGASFGLKNNSNYDTEVVVVAAGYKNGKIISDGVYYKKVALEAAKTATEEISGMEFSETPDIIKIYAVDSIDSFMALTSPKEG